jgi:hypothetical protein
MMKCKDMKGTCIFKALIQYFPWGTEENHGNPLSGFNGLGANLFIYGLLTDAVNTVQKQFLYNYFSEDIILSLLYTLTESG